MPRTASLNGASSRAQSKQSAEHGAKYKFYVTRQKHGFFKWRTAVPTAPSSKRVSRGYVDRGSGTTSRTDQAGQCKDTAEEKQPPVPVPKPSTSLRHSSVDFSVILPGQEDQYLIHEIVDYTRKSYWHALAPPQHPFAAP
ncbi:hypothetical protein GJ744_007535 [Endocarpon pusillum]|uniref:Uncharacterized protein n=1 Tax=Endocarpon pusillum TaxID=364733 RepID=A0A8H7E403_9EURO|nr:hypothetical protein GJ744_007535 [Endocarpon pusillum]